MSTGSEREYEDAVDRWLADTEQVMREFEGRAILYGEEAACAWRLDAITRWRLEARQR